MIFNSHVNGHSLSEEVKLAEQRLQLRRKSLHKGLHTLDLAVRQRVTAPDSLLWGVGTGYILGEITKKRGATHATNEKVPEHAGSRSAEDEASARPGTIQLILHYWAVARPIIATATSILAPYIQAKAAHAGASVAVHEAMNEAGETHATHQHPS